MLILSRSTLPRVATIFLVGSALQWTNGAAAQTSEPRITCEVRRGQQLAASTPEHPMFEVNSDDYLVLKLKIDLPATARKKAQYIPINPRPTPSFGPYITLRVTQDSTKEVTAKINTSGHIESPTGLTAWINFLIPEDDKVRQEQVMKWRDRHKTELDSASQKMSSDHQVNDKELTDLLQRGIENKPGLYNIVCTYVTSEGLVGGHIDTIPITIQIVKKKTFLDE